MTPAVGPTIYGEPQAHVKCAVCGSALLECHVKTLTVADDGTHSFQPVCAEHIPPPESNQEIVVRLAEQVRRLEATLAHQRSANVQLEAIRYEVAVPRSNAYVGAPVLYLLDKGPRAGQLRPAIVTAVLDNSAANLTVFMDGPGDFHSDPKDTLHRPARKQGTNIGEWRWP